MRRTRTFKCCLLALVMASAAASAAPTTLHSQVADRTASSWQAVESVGRPSARHENSAAVVGREVFLFGGRGQRPLDVFNVDTGTWRQGAAPPMEVHHAQAAVLDGQIYVIGAMTGNWPREDIVPRVLIYDPKTDQWSEGPALPEDRRRGGSGLVVDGGVFYLIGGNRFGHEAGFVPWLDAFDPAGGEWKRLPDAPHARDHFHAAVLNGRIYAAGGRQSGHEQGAPLGLAVPAMDVYDISSARWSTAPTPLPTPRSGVAVAAVDGKIVVLGGESADQASAHVEVEAFDPSTSTWSRLDDMPVGRHGTQAVAVDDALHLIAGSGNRGGGPELDDHWVFGFREAGR